MTHWAETYLGHVWQAGAQGPEVWDCWSFFRHVQATYFGREVPTVGIDATNIHAVAHAIAGHNERAHWEEVNTPNDGDAALLAHSRYPSHVGVFLAIDGGGVLHCQAGAGVIFTPTSKLAVSGWGRVNYFRPVAA